MAKWFKVWYSADTHNVPHLHARIWKFELFLGLVRIDPATA